ncbi:chromosome segregation protein SMC [Bacillus sp. 2205SS5-2]|uniref:chromosome segregation protein SMC n=1 Tax=Bacillus sp. 2205SS5-2 TaxID=3109031 RepID=UPI003004AE85
MFLKRLDVVGFKSFAERVSVEFVSGVTAVVGPNGSGKSNITDAIRWVLGEQSAKSLRGAKMEDIIFGGSDSRKPLNFAEVTLTLDNEDQFLPIDYNEVSISRRVFRSGDSEYLINKQNCRLKDIVDLFMDSGLGREAFSIISQGRVEEILNSKAEDRRTIFEEAAGVLKYKNRKKKAENKLDETQENLNRVQDILHELEGQVEPLKIQASMAKEFLEKKDELKAFEVGVTVHEIEEIHKHWEASNQQLEEQSAKELTLSTLLTERETDLILSRDQMVALDESITDLQDVLLSVSEELKKLEGRKEVLKERKKNASQNKEQLQRTIEELTIKLETLIRQKREIEEENTSLSQTVLQLKEELGQTQRDLKSLNEDIEGKIESLKSDYFDKLNQQANIRNEKQYLAGQLEQQATRTSRLHLENEKYVFERAEIEKKKEHLTLNLKELRQTLDDQVILYRNEQSALEQNKKKYQKQESALYQAYQFLQQAKSRKEMLEEMEEGFAGFFQGVKEVLKERDGQLSGVQGAVAELISVEKEYEKAIETALGAALQHIVVDNEQNARAAISYLKKNQYGRATFLPMTIIKGKSIQTSLYTTLSNHDSFIGLGAELIEFEEKYQPVISSLLGTVVITKDLKGANEIAKLTSFRYRMVTLDGDVVNPGGSMTGGTMKQKSNSLLTRKGELEDIKEKLMKMEEQTHQREYSVKSLKATIEHQEKKIESARLKGEQLRLKEQEFKAQSREVDLSQQNMNERLALYDLEMKDFDSSHEKINLRQQELDQTLEELEIELVGINRNIEDLTRKKAEQSASKEELTLKLSEVKETLAVKAEQLSHSAKQLDFLEEETVNATQKKQRMEEDFVWLKEEMTNNFSGEEKLDRDAVEVRKQKEDTTNLISVRREERLKLVGLIEDKERELKEYQRQHRGISGFLKDEEVRMNRLDVELDNRLNHLREEYALSFEAAKQEFPLNSSVDEAQKKVKLIKLAIDELGNVNIGAIEEYDRVSERYDFLLEQKNDLQEAKDTLFQVIDEMDEEMVKRFEWTFTSIREHFDEVFRSLFGGGRADLVLTNPGDLLRTGVEIVAQPPGKKLQNLSLLSGGERALTAIALLFSILKVRPVPFCILDEVEAALDEANVQRFSSYLKKFSEESQFIVITHRKGTMEEADVLYGVTMQESGVSKLVSVKLEETQQLMETN